MNPENFPVNGLPQELADIPYGQIFILTNPYLGITSNNIFMMQFIFSMARQFKQFHIVNALPVEYSGLWGCFACKVQTAKGCEVLVADKDSLIEMLCEFWRLDYSEVCKTIKIANRYKAVSMGGHPMRAIPKIAVETDKAVVRDILTPSLSLITLARNHDEVMGDIRSTFKEIFYDGHSISLEDIIALYNYEKEHRKTYTLSIKVEWEKVLKSGYTHPVKKIKDCHICLIDNTGTEYPLKMGVQPKAIYLTFIALGKNYWIKDISGDEEFYNTFKKIYLQLPYSSKPSMPKNFNNLYPGTDQYTLFLQKTGKIRDAIMDATNDNYARVQFAVEGNASIPFGVAGATDEIRALVRKEFRLE